MNNTHDVLKLYLPIYEPNKYMELIFNNLTAAIDFVRTTGLAHSNKICTDKFDVTASPATNTKNVNAECGLTGEQIPASHLTHELKINGVLVGYSSFNIFYNQYQNPSIIQLKENPNKHTLMDKLDFQFNEPLDFFKDGVAISRYQWLDDLVQEEPQERKNKYQIHLSCQPNPIQIEFDTFLQADKVSNLDINNPEYALNLAIANLLTEIESNTKHI